jgi:hypothetical protein
MPDDFVLPSDAPAAPQAFTLPSDSPSEPAAQAPSVGQKLMQTWPAQLVKSAYQGATLPGDVASGATDVVPSKPGMWSDEDEARLQATNAEIADRASSLAGFTSPSSVAARAGEGVAGVALTPRSVGEATAPTIPELKGAAVAGYESPTVANVQIHAAAGPRLSQEIQTNLNEAGIDENLAPKTFGILGKLEKVPQGDDGGPQPFLTVDNLRSLRRTLGNAAGSIDPTERLAAKSAQQHLDEFLSNLPAADVIQGNPQAAAQILQQANGNYAAMARAADLDQRMTKAYLRAKAANSGMNIANTIRQRMVDIASNPKLGRGLTPDEMDQVRQIAEGTPLENTMRHAGNILGGGGGLLTAMYGMGALATHGVTALAPIAGWALRKMSNSMAMGKAADLGESIRMRSPLGQQRQAAAMAQTARPDLSGGRLALPPLAQAVRPFVQGPAAVEAQAQQNSVPGVEQQQNTGGAVRQKQGFAHGGGIKPESGRKGKEDVGHERPVDSGAQHGHPNGRFRKG